MCDAPGMTTAVALSAGASCRATARGAVKVFSPSRIVVGGGDSESHASVAASDRVMVISNPSFGLAQTEDNGSLEFLLDFTRA